MTFQIQSSVRRLLDEAFGIIFWQMEMNEGKLVLELFH
jgi:hypothetical protein